MRSESRSQSGLLTGGGSHAACSVRYDYPMITPSTPSPRAELWAGVRTELPIALGVIPFGLIFGVIALASGLSPVLAASMSSIIFAGSAQFIGSQMIGAGAPALIVILTTLVVNLRHVLYGFSLGLQTGHLPRRWRWLLAYLLTDEAYAAAIVHYRDEAISLAHKHWFWLGSGFTLWGVWQLSSFAGVFLGARVPASWSLDFTLALTFIGIVVPGLRDHPSRAAALAAGVVAVLAFGLPYKLGLMLAAVAGILVGVFIERGQ